MADQNAPDVRIAAMTVRGRGLSADSGRELATAVAGALVGYGRAEAAQVDHLSLRLPASVITADGRIDHAVIAAALNRRRSAPDA